MSRLKEQYPIKFIKDPKNAAETITLEYQDGTRTTYPLEMVMKQDYQTLIRIYPLIDRNYYFN